MDSQPYDVIGIGNALTDITVTVTDAFLKDNGLVKGSMTLVDHDQAAQLHSLLPPGSQASGGSCSNSMAGLAALGGRAAYIGRVRDDRIGGIFRQEIRAAGVDFDTPPATGGPGSGLCLVMVTPDAERTMCTFLGAASSLGPEDIQPETIRRGRILYLEGYLFDRDSAKKAFTRAAETAHAAAGGRRVALSLSDPFCVDRHREAFQHLVAHHIDILFGNRQEYLSLYQTSSLEAALDAARSRCSLACVTDGAAGALLATASGIVTVPAVPVDRVVDSNGAGDQYAAGVLFGLSRNAPLEICGRIGALTGAEAVSHYGARPQRDLKQEAAALLAG